MCGIIGVVGKKGYHVNQLIYDGLTVLQHRGQDAAGIMTEHEGQFRLRKSNGLVPNIFYLVTCKDCRVILELAMLGILRGTSSKAESQPFYVNSPYGLSIARNGNLTNAAELRTILSDKYLGI